MAAYTKNTIKDLFNSSLTGKKDFLEYYEKSERNLTGKFQVQWSIARNFDMNVRDNRLRIVEGIGQKALDAFIKQNYKLNTIKWEWLEEDTIKLIRDYCVEATLKIITNKGAIERMNASSIQGGGITINQDIDAYLLNADVMGRFAWNCLTNSGINDYEVISNIKYIETENGNMKVIGKIDTGKYPEIKEME